MSEEYAVEIEAGSDSDVVTVPESALEALAEDEDTPAQVAGDLVMLGLAQQLHTAVHHGGGDLDEQIEEAEAELMDDFEERFGVTYGEMTGHSH